MSFNVDLYGENKMEEHVVYSLVLVILFTGQINAEDYPEAEIAYCQPYCDVYGYYKSGVWCISNTEKAVYCCGTENYRECCTDPEQDVTDKYPAVTECPNSSWWVYHWRVIIGLLGTLMMVLIVSSCCYYCCVHALSRRRRNTATTERETEMPSVVSNVSEAASGGATFDPQHPYAFVPPDYDSLPKEPPKYAEVFERDSANAHTNEAFELDVPPPPPQGEGYSVEEEPGTPPPKYEDVPIHTTNVPDQINISLNPFTGLPVGGVASNDPVNPSSN